MKLEDHRHLPATIAEGIQEEVDQDLALDLDLLQAAVVLDPDLVLARQYVDRDPALRLVEIGSTTAEVDNQSIKAKAAGIHIREVGGMTGIQVGDRNAVDMGIEVGMVRREVVTERSGIGDRMSTTFGSILF